MPSLFDQIFTLGKEYIDTIKHKAKLSTIFDFFTEKVIPTFVNENDLKEFYEKRMNEVDEFIYKL